jgi:hypothetical protein
LTHHQSLEAAVDIDKAVGNPIEVVVITDDLTRMVAFPRACAQAHTFIEVFAFRPDRFARQSPRAMTIIATRAVFAAVERP